MVDNHLLLSTELILVQQKRTTNKRKVARIPKSNFASFCAEPGIAIHKAQSQSQARDTVVV
jgi:hypothetical protein